MAQDYTIHTFNPGKEPFKDHNGNQWVNVLFEGHLSTPTKWVMRPESVNKWKPGMTVFGRLEQPEGKNYQRFYKEQKPDGYGSNQASGQLPTGSKYSKSAEEQEHIARSVALKASVDLYAKAETTNRTIILDTANVFLAWLTNGSKESAASPTPSADSSDSLSKHTNIMPFEGDEIPIDDDPRYQ